METREAGSATEERRALIFDSNCCFSADLLCRRVRRAASLSSSAAFFASSLATRAS